MKIVITRVSRAKVEIEGTQVSEINRGFLVLVGIATDDTIDDVQYLAGKLAKLRVFTDDAGKLNLSCSEIGGEILAVSNFTLCGDCTHGNRPSFAAAARPEVAKPLYEAFCDEVSEYGIPVKRGVFGADMQVYSVNDGPVTIIMESRKNA